MSLGLVRITFPTLAQMVPPSTFESPSLPPGGWKILKSHLGDSDWSLWLTLPLAPWYLPSHYSCICPYSCPVWIHPSLHLQDSGVAARPSWCCSVLVGLDAFLLAPALASPLQSWFSSSWMGPLKCVGMLGTSAWEYKAQDLRNWGRAPQGLTWEPYCEMCFLENLVWAPIQAKLVHQEGRNLCEHLPLE